MNTRAAVVGIGYQLWRRTRWFLLATIAQVAALGVAVHVLRAPEMFIALVELTLIGIAAPVVVQAITFGGDHSRRESGFPRHMMVLPLSASALALTPILYGIALIEILWFAAGELVFVPIGAPAPGLWAALVPAASLAWLAATSWMPFWFPFARVIASIGSLLAIAVFTAVTRAYLVPEWITVAGLLAATAMAFVAAVGGVARARRGDGTVSPWAAHRTAGSKPAPLVRPFKSAERAQIWFELRRNCTMPAGFALFMAAISFPLLLSPQHIDLVDVFIFPVPFLPTAIFLLAPVLAFSIMGGSFAKPDAWETDMWAPAFLAARPTSDRFLIAAKMKASALTIIFIWMIVLALVGISTVIPHGDSQAETLPQFVSRHATPGRAVIAVACLAGLVLLTWINVIKSFAFNLCGRKWIGVAMLFTYTLVISALSWVGQWGFHHPESRPALLSAGRIAMSVLIAAKIGTAIPMLRAVRHGHVAGDAQLLAWTAIWMLAVLTLLGLTFRAVPIARHSGLALAACVVLLLPYNRIIAMPLAWHHNRHR